MRGLGSVLIVGLFLAMLATVGPLRGMEGQFLRPNVESLAEVNVNYLAELQQAHAPRAGLQAALEKNLALLPVSKTTGPVSFPQIINILGLGQLNSLVGMVGPLAILSVGIRLIGFAVPKRR